MTRKTVKDLEGDLSAMKEDLDDTKVKMNELVLLCKKLTKSFAIDIKCDDCETEFETYKDLKEHRKSHSVQTEKIVCEECGCEFLEKWKFNAHLKSHVVQKKYGCIVCSKTFKSEEIKTKHMKITHENVKLFCHFYNNRMPCPYDDTCVFLHKDAPLCRYGGRCERINCMFKHIILEYSNDDEDSEDEESEDENDDDDISSEESEEIVSGEKKTKTKMKDKNDVIDENDVIVEVHNEEEDVDQIVVAGKIETVYIKVYVPCRDPWLSKDQTFYTDELRKFPEIESIENLWIISKNNYEVGTYLETNLKFFTRFADNFNNDASYRQSVWDRLGIKDTCPDQGE